MTIFVGSTTHSLDEKGRLVLPAKFRADFVNGGYITPSVAGSLALWTPGEFNRQSKQIQEGRSKGVAERDLARYWGFLTEAVDFDKQGRFLIPKMLRERTGIDGEVLINGNLDRIEIWNPTKFHELTSAAFEAFGEAMR